jgi:hypothetical protein
VVKNLKGSKAKVTWGNTTQEYTAGQLAAGINLAADFRDNPFSAQFAQVQAAVLVQAAQETTLSKMYMHNLGSWKATFAPGVDSAWDQITTAGMKQHDALYQKAASLVVPITHTIKIEPEP